MGAETPFLDSDEINTSFDFDCAGFALEPSIYESITSQTSTALEMWLASGPQINTYSDDENDGLLDGPGDDYTPGNVQFLSYLLILH